MTVTQKCHKFLEVTQVCQWNFVTCPRIKSTYSCAELENLAPTNVVRLLLTRLCLRYAKRKHIRKRKSCRPLCNLANEQYRDICTMWEIALVVLPSNKWFSSCCGSPRARRLKVESCATNWHWISFLDNSSHYNPVRKDEDSVRLYILLMQQ